MRNTRTLLIPDCRGVGWGRSDGRFGKMTGRFNFTAGFLALVCLNAQAQENEAAWKETLARVIPSVVTIQNNQVRSFDTERRKQLDGTGFVVDAERGIILTNRHVVSTGPIRAEVLFANQEEIEVQRIYADPVHDFGFLRYDPDDLRTGRPSAIPIAPEAAEVGREIRVVGNDAGNRVSILDGTLARLDQAAPDYGVGKYNDFNTFYLQASSGTSGGSSGSPVVDIEGRAVGLNAGAHTRAATSFFLPLNRVQRALELIRGDQPVPRGGLLTTFEQLPYDELRRLGLTEASETGARAVEPDSAGLLAVRSMVKESPASTKLRLGDILIRIEDEEFPDFARLESVLDDNVGRAVELLVERQGSVLGISMEVTNLHEVTPSEYITLGDAILHQVSYQQARNFNVPLDTIYVADRGYMLRTAGIPSGAILAEINGSSLKDLDDVEEALAPMRHGEVVQLRYTNPRVSNNSRLRSGRVSRRWFAAERCRQGASSHDWSCTVLSAPPPPKPIEPRAASARKFVDRRLERIGPSLVYATFHMPFRVSGIDAGRYSGTGLIVDAGRGWVVVDRSSVPEAIGDALLTFNGSLEVTAEVAYIHPVHNLAVLQYDPALLRGTPIREANFAPRLPRTGEQIDLAALRRDQDLLIRTYEAGELRLIDSRLNSIGAFRDSNMEILNVDNVDQNLSGVLLDSRGRIGALWSGFYEDYRAQFEMTSASGTLEVKNVDYAGLPIEHVRVMLDHLRREAPWRSPEVEWQRVPLSEALGRGLPDIWRTRVEQQEPERLNMLSVARTVAGTPSAGAMLPGDLLLSINDRFATRTREVELAVEGGTEAEVLLWRNGREVKVKFDTVQLGWGGLREVMFWAGALLQNPQRGIAAQLGIEPQGVSVQKLTVASPAYRALNRLKFFQITRINDTATPDLDAFADALKKAREAGSVRVEGITDKGKPVFGTVKLDSEYWPTYTLRHGPGGWERLRLGE